MSLCRASLLPQASALLRTTPRLAAESRSLALRSKQLPPGRRKKRTCRFPAALPLSTQSSSPRSELEDETRPANLPGPCLMAAPGGSDAGDGAPGGWDTGGKGYRRRKLAAMAGNLYRTSQQAVTEFRDSYAQTKFRSSDGEAASQASLHAHIPVSFPDVAIAAHGDEQMVLFPSYAKRHLRRDWSRVLDFRSELPRASSRDEEYWHLEWEKNLDEKAIVDVDVRGWIYSPQSGPMTRRNRILVGLARQLSGISAPKPDPAPPGPPLRTSTSESAPPSPSLSARQSSAALGDLTEAELVIANANLMARIAPFMTNPLAALPITIFFYNETKSESRTAQTNDAGHFNLRAPLDFVPTQVRVLANERLSATQDVTVTEPRGVSLISDVDDTVKHSNVSAGAREMFRNTFVRELADLTIDGVSDWYSQLQELGVCFHYCSNSPWQLFPVLASFFKLGGLPPGSLHLKQYSGMLQGIFEPVAERKKSTLNRLMDDFPLRKFLLVGDSGEADLEVYTDLALAYPGRVLAIFIRDVTTPESDTLSVYTASDPASGPPSIRDSDASKLSVPSLTPGKGSRRQNSAPAAATTTPADAAPLTGTLIDLSKEPAPTGASAISGRRPMHSNSAVDLLSSCKPPPPPPPAKPLSLRGLPSAASVASSAGASRPPRLPTRTVEAAEGSRPPSEAPASASGYGARAGEPPPLPRRPASTGRRRFSPRLFGSQPASSSSSDLDFEPLPPPSVPPPMPGPAALPMMRGGTRSGTATPLPSPPLGPQVNKKLDLWRRRLVRAHDLLDRQGVALYTWRRGQDVACEAVAIVKQALDGLDAQKDAHAATRRATD